MADQNVLKDLEQFYSDNPLKVWIPSLNEEHNFKPISVGQQKTLFDLETDDPDLEYFVNAPKALNQLIGLTCMDESVYNSITVIDRPVILLQLKYNVKNTIILTIDGEVYDIDLKVFVTGLKNKAKKPKKLKFKNMFSVGNVFVYVRPPNLASDELYNNYFLATQDGRPDVGIDELTGEAFFAEVAKFIDRITFDNGDGESTYNFNELDQESLAKNLELLANLPSTITSRVSDYIALIKEYQINLVTEKIKVKGGEKNVFLDIDIPFFTTL